MRVINKLLVLYFFSISSLFGISLTNIDDMQNVSLDAKIHALGGTHLNQSMSLHDIISLSSYHTKNKILFSYLNQFSEISYMNISYIMVDTNKRKMGISLATRSVKDFHTGGFYDSNGDEIPQLNEIDYSDIDYYNHQEYNFLYMGSIVNGDKSFGFKLKTNFTSVYQSKAYGFGVDLGTQGKIGNLGYGVLVNNVFSYRYWDTGQTYSARPTIIFSSSYNKRKATISLDLGIKNINSLSELEITNAFGLNFSMAKNFSIRLGKTALGPIVFGFGLATDGVEVNYAYNPNLFDNVFGQDHQISILLTLSELKKIRGVILP